RCSLTQRAYGWVAYLPGPRHERAMPARGDKWRASHCEHAQRAYAINVQGEEARMPLGVQVGLRIDGFPLTKMRSQGADGDDVSAAGVGGDATPISRRRTAPHHATGATLDLPLGLPALGRYAPCPSDGARPSTNVMEGRTDVQITILYVCGDEVC